MFKENELIAKHKFKLDKNASGGEELTLETKMFANGDPGGIYLNQELVLQSYCNSASIRLVGSAITPSTLRELANQLESAVLQAQAKTYEKASHKTVALDR